MQPSWRIIRRVADLMFPTYHIRKTLEALDIFLAALGKMLFTKIPSEVRALRKPFVTAWKEMCRYFPDTLVQLPNFKTASDYIDVHLWWHLNAHGSMGLRVEHWHQLVKQGVFSH